MIVYVRTGDDWEGLYKDGQLFTEGHEVTYKDILRALDMACPIVMELWIDGTSKKERLNLEGSLPKTLAELEKW